MVVPPVVSFRNGRTLPIVILTGAGPGILKLIEIGAIAPVRLGHCGAQGAAALAVGAAAVARVGVSRVARVCDRERVAECDGRFERARGGRRNAAWASACAEVSWAAGATIGTAAFGAAAWPMPALTAWMSTASTQPSPFASAAELAAPHAVPLAMASCHAAVTVSRS